MLNNIVALICGIALLVSMTTVDAGKLDSYRSMIANNTFTLRYEILTPQSSQNRRREATVYGQELLSANEQLKNRSYKGVVVANGNDRYTEIAYPGEKTVRHKENDDEQQIVEKGERALCMLIKQHFTTFLKTNIA